MTRSFKASELAFAISLLIAFAFSLSGCAVFHQNPIVEAETAQQKAYAAYGQFVILQERAADIIRDPTYHSEVKQAIRDAHEAAHPIATDLLGAAIEVMRIQAELLAGESTEAKLRIATSRLLSWQSRLQPALTRLIKTVGDNT